MTSHGASVRPRPRRDGSAAYDVRYRLDGVQCTKSFEDPESAEKWAKIVRTVGPQAALDYLKITSKEGTPTVDDYAEQFISAKSGVEPKTLDHYRMFMRLHISPTLGHFPLDAVTHDMIAAWVNSKDGAASKTIKNWHSFLSSMFQRAVEDSIIDRNPCTRTRIPETERQEMVFLSPNEFTTLLSYVPERWQPLVLLLASTGLRWGEATALRPSDFDLEAGTVRVSRSWKSSKARGWYIGPPKTRRSKRTVSLPDDLLPILQPLLKAGHEYVFVNGMGNPVRNAKFHELVWQPAVRLANGEPPFKAARSAIEQPWTARAKGVWDGRKPAHSPIGKRPRVHDLRHCHVSWLLAEGIGIDVISRRLGHESIQTTMGTYGHISVERAAGAGIAVGRALAGAMPQIMA
jgi:integrase